MHVPVPHDVFEDAFLSVFIGHDAAHKYNVKILCCFGCGWKGEVWENFKVL